MTGLLLIATGKDYWRFAKPLIDSAEKFFVPHRPILFTDCPHRFTTLQVYQPNAGYPKTTLNRYHTFLKYRKFLERFDNLFYVDIDALFVAPVGGEIFSPGITATTHFGWNLRDAWWYEEARPESAAHFQHLKSYFCGGFNGGSTRAYLDMAEAIREAVDYDTAKGIVAKWHDETHLNKYLSIYPPAKILPAEYCYPETHLHLPNSAKILCLEKNPKSAS